MMLAVEGLALYRSLFSGTDASVKDRIDAMRSTVAALDDDDGHDPIEQLSVLVEERTLDAGYREWATTYDELTNPLIEFEESTLLPILDAITPGAALDVCCGTGRVLAHLDARGHEVVGLDGSSDMLLLAASKVGVERLVCGDIVDPQVAGRLGRDRFDVVTCCLALTHYVSLTDPIAAIAAVARPGATIVLSDIHPFWTMLDAQGFFVVGDGRTGFVRNHHHRHADYLDAFAAAGLAVRRCLEPTAAPGTGPFVGTVPALRPEAAAVAYTGAPFVLLWVLERIG